MRRFWLGLALPLAFLGVLAVASPAMAAGTFTVFPVQSYDTTQHVSQTASYNGKSELVTLSVTGLTVAQWQALPSQLIEVDIQQSFDNGQTWQDFAPMFWQTGSLDKQGQIPQNSAQVGDALGARRVRAVLTVQQTITIGFTLVVSPG